MGLDNKIKTVITAAGLSGRQLAPLFNSTPEVAAVKISRGVKKIDELINRAKTIDPESMEYHPDQDQVLKDLQRAKDGTVIPLTVEDLPSKDAAQ